MWPDTTCRRVHIDLLERKENSNPKDSLNKKELAKRKDTVNNKDSAKFLLADRSEQFNKIRRILNTGFDEAAVMMEKALTLLKNDSELLQPIYPKYNFLKAASLENSENKSKLKEGLYFARKAIAQDDNAAYNYAMMGRLLQSLKNDSCVYYFNKAIALAPNWAFPVVGLGRYYDDKLKHALAIDYYRKAFSIDSLYANALTNIGSIYHNLNLPDSAKYYYNKALQIDPCNTYANANLGSLYFDSSDNDSNYFNLSKQYLLKSITCDSTYSWAYNKISELFEQSSDEHSKDSIIYYLKLGIRRVPNYTYNYQKLGDTYINLYDDLNDYNSSLDRKVITDSVAFLKHLAESYYLKTLQVDSSDIFTYTAIGDFYKRLEDTTNALKYFRKAINLEPLNPDAYTELGSYFSKEYSTDSARKYYHIALHLDSTLAYVHNNLALTFDWDNNKDSTIFYYTKALYYDSIRYSSLRLTLAQLYLYGQKGNYEKAILYYTSYLDNEKKGETAVDAVDELVNVYFKLKRFAEAENAIKKYLTEKESYKTYNGLMGLLCAHYGKAYESELYLLKASGLKAQEAKEYLDKKTFAFTLLRDLPDREGLLAKIYTENLRYIVSDEEVQKEIDVKIHIDSNYFFKYSHTLSSYLWGGRFGPGIELDSLLSITAKDDANKLSYKIIIASHVDDWVQALTEYPKSSFSYNKIIPVKYDIPEKVTGFSNSHRDFYFYINTLSTISRKDSLNARLFINIADLYLKVLTLLKFSEEDSQKQRDSLITFITDSISKFYRRALYIDNKFEVVACNRLGDFYRSISKEEIAKKYYYRSISSDPKFIYPYMRLGDLYRKEQNSDSAFCYYKKALDIDSGFLPLYFDVSEELIKLGKRKDALLLLEKALKVDKDFIPSYEKLIEYYSSENVSKTLFYLETVLHKLNATNVYSATIYNNMYRFIREEKLETIRNNSQFIALMKKYPQKKVEEKWSIMYINYINQPGTR